MAETRANAHRIAETDAKVRHALRASYPTPVTKAQIERAAGVTHRAVTRAIGRLGAHVEAIPVTARRRGPRCADGSPSEIDFPTTAYRLAAPRPERPPPMPDLDLGSVLLGVVIGGAAVLTLLGFAVVRWMLGGDESA